MTASSANSYAVSCQEVIQKADKALADKDKQIEIRDLRLKDAEVQTAKLSSDLKETQDKLSSIWRNPWFYFGVGVITGAVLLK